MVADILGSASQRDGSCRHGREVLDIEICLADDADRHAVPAERLEESSSPLTADAPAGPGSATTQSVGPGDKLLATITPDVEESVPPVRGPSCVGEHRQAAKSLASEVDEVVCVCHIFVVYGNPEAPFKTNLIAPRIQQGR